MEQNYELLDEDMGKILFEVKYSEKLGFKTQVMYVAALSPRDIIDLFEGEFMNCTILNMRPLACERLVPLANVAARLVLVS